MEKKEQFVVADGLQPSIGVGDDASRVASNAVSSDPARCSRQGDAHNAMRDH
jgi:hypothetical protein